MSSVRDRLTRYFATTGAADDPELDPRRIVLESAYLEVLGRAADEYGEEHFLPEIGAGLDDERLRHELSFSPDGRNKDVDLLTSLRVDLHPLLAAAKECGRSVRDLRVYEVMAAFQVCLGRWPDPAGFENYLRLPASTPLRAIVKGIEASAEARGARGRFRPPRLGRSTERARALAPTLLLLGALSQLPGLLEQTSAASEVSARLDRMETSLLLAVRQLQASHDAVR